MIDIAGYSVEYVGRCGFFHNVRLSDAIDSATCPYLLHAIVPYYYSYLHGGEFTWSNMTNHVAVRCPDVLGNVATDIHNCQNDIICIVESAEKCPKSYSRGNQIIFQKTFDLMCPLVFDTLFPWLLGGTREAVTLCCPGCNEHSPVKFRLRYCDES